MSDVTYEVAKCNRCQHLFNHSTKKIPKYLSCLHTVCLDCVTELSAEDTNNHHITCPRDITDFSSYLPTNFRLPQQHQQQLSLPAMNTCDNCEIEAACVQCLDCDHDCSRLCDACATKHKLFKAFRDHRLTDLSQSQSQSLVQGSNQVNDNDNGNGNGSDRDIDIDEIVQQLTVPEKLPVCVIHPHKQLNAFCLSCRRVVCLSCATFDPIHASHAIVSHTDGAAHEREAMRQAVSGLGLHIDIGHQAMRDVECNLSALADQKQLMVESVKKSFRDLKNKLNNNQERQSIEVTITCTQYHSSVTERILRIATLQLLCHRFIYVSSFYIHSSNSHSDILEGQAQLTQTCQGVMSENRVCQQHLPPLAYCDGTFRQLKQFIDSFAIVWGGVLSK